EVAHDDARRNIRRGLLHLIGQLRLVLPARIPRPDGGDEVAAAAAAAGAQDEIAGDERRTDAPLVERLAVFPEHFAAVRIERGNTVCLAIEDERRLAVLRFIHARGGVGHNGAAARRLPNCFARLRVHGHDETVAAARAFLDELLVVLVVTENDFVLVEYGRCAA